jgi:hypothetical protein
MEITKMLYRFHFVGLMVYVAPLELINYCGNYCYKYPAAPELVNLLEYPLL